MRTAFATILAALGGCSATAPATKPPTVAMANTPAKAVTLRPVTMAEVEAAVAAEKGQVVVIDVWFLGCAPCVKKWPTFVALHEEFAAEGLACMSLDVVIEENETFDKVEAFLKEKNAAFPNFIVKDTEANRDRWQSANDADATPSYVVYDRAGQRVKLPQVVKPEDIRELVKKLLAAK